MMKHKARPTAKWDGLEGQKTKHLPSSPITFELSKGLSPKIPCQGTQPQNPSQRGAESISNNMFDFA